MACAFRLSVQLKMCPPDDLEAVLQHLQRVGLPFLLQHLPFAANPERLLERMRQDKKNRNGRTTFILLQGIGHAVIRRDVEDADVLEMLRRA